MAHIGLWLGFRGLGLSNPKFEAQSSRLSSSAETLPLPLVVGLRHLSCK